MYEIQNQSKQKCKDLSFLGCTVLDCQHGYKYFFVGIGRRKDCSREVRCCGIGDGGVSILQSCS